MLIAVDNLLENLTRHINVHFKGLSLNHTDSYMIIRVQLLVIARDEIALCMKAIVKAALAVSVLPSLRFSESKWFRETDESNALYSK